MALQLDDIAALDSPTVDACGLPLMLALDAIDEDPEQPRHEFDANALQEYTGVYRRQFADVAVTVDGGALKLQVTPKMPGLANPRRRSKATAPTPPRAPCSCLEKLAALNTWARPSIRARGCSTYRRSAPRSRPT